MKKHFRVSTALLAAVLLAGCGSISSKDGGYYATESPSAEGAYDTAAGAANSSIVPEELPDSTDETAQKIIYNADINMESTDFDAARDTLLAAVDSSVGGKTAVDLTAGKNLAGAFCQPAAVICDTDCLKTLPPDVFADGAAEAVKTGVLSDEALFALFEDGTLTADPGEVIARCVAYKAGVVERDEKEQGERKLLNLGHTVGHAIEKCSGYVIPHGHAVAAGLAVIARAAEALGWTEESLAARITACLSKNGLPTGTDYSAEALAEAALSDKKRAGGDITLVVPQKIGHCELRKVPVADLLPIIRAGLEA